MDTHIPDLAAIKQVERGDVRFYAIIGAVMSVAAAVELAYFDLFRAAIGLPRGTGRPNLLRHQDRWKPPRNDGAGDTAHVIG